MLIKLVIVWIFSSSQKRDAHSSWEKVIHFSPNKNVCLSLWCWLLPSFFSTHFAIPGRTGKMLSSLSLIGTIFFTHLHLFRRETREMGKEKGSNIICNVRATSSKIRMRECVCVSDWIGRLGFTLLCSAPGACIRISSLPIYSWAWGPCCLLIEAETRRESFSSLSSKEKEKKRGRVSRISFREFRLIRPDSRPDLKKRERRNNIPLLPPLYLFRIICPSQRKRLVTSNEGAKVWGVSRGTKQKKRRFIRLVSEGSQGTVEEWTRSKGIPSPISFFFLPKLRWMLRIDGFFFFFFLVSLFLSILLLLLLRWIVCGGYPFITSVAHRVVPFFRLAFPFFFFLVWIGLPFGDSWRIVHDHSRIHWRGWPTRIVFPYGGSKWRRVYPICSTWARVLIRSIFTHLKGCLPLHCVYQVTFFLMKWWNSH